MRTYKFWRRAYLHSYMSTPPPAALAKMSALQRHHHILRQGFKTDEDALRAAHRFLWDDDEDGSSAAWDVRLAKEYYRKLFREYALADFSRYKEGAVGLRAVVEHVDERDDRQPLVAARVDARGAGGDH